LKVKEWYFKDSLSVLNCGCHFPLKHYTFLPQKWLECLLLIASLQRVQEKSEESCLKAH
jgi:hypothetical protein